MRRRTRGLLRIAFKLAFNGLAVLSLVLAVLVAGLWVHSHEYGGKVLRYRNPSYIECTSAQGVARITVGWLISMHYPPPEGWTFDVAPFTGHFEVSDNLWKRGFAGFWGKHSASNGTFLSSDGWSLQIPWYALFLLSAAMPTLLICRAMRRRRFNSGQLCPTCGYDLRATPDRCPECGTVPKGASV